MKLNFIYAALLATAIVVPTSAQVSVYIGSPPPPLRIETPGPMPGPGYAWVDGYWAPNGRHYRWVAGRWDRPPYEGAYWNHPHYDITGKAGNYTRDTGTTKTTISTPKTMATARTIATKAITTNLSLSRD